jgi:phage-related protein
MEKLEFKISIAADKHKVWDTMLHPDTYKEWVAASWPDSFYKGHWAENENISFISEDGSGTLAHIETFVPYKYILAKHIAVLNAGGVEDTESEFAKNWIGISESYTFDSTGEGTELTINIETREEWKKMFNDGWPGALAKLKAICEQ